MTQSGKKIPYALVLAAVAFAVVSAIVLASFFYRVGSRPIAKPAATKLEGKIELGGILKLEGKIINKWWRWWQWSHEPDKIYCHGVIFVKTTNRTYHSFEKDIVSFTPTDPYSGWNIGDNVTVTITNGRESVSKG